MVCLLLLVITWIVALTTITRHIRHYYDPNIQRHKLRVLLYPPVYATLSWISYLRYDYSTTIMFFATLFEALAIYNLYTCLEAYLQPFRDEAGETKEPVHTKVFGLFNVNLKSKFGFHFRTITTIMVLQYPLWAIIDALISIVSSVKGYYCAESYSFQGAYVYLTIINFILLSVILSALFTYLAVFHEEWKRGQISAHGMFWCVKGPVMAIFYFGDILLSILETCNVIKGTDGSQSSDGLAWPAAAVKNGLDVIIICVVMVVASFLMNKYFGPQREIMKSGNNQRVTGWKAFLDAYISYIPEFVRNILCCGIDSYRLARKRAELRKRKKQGMYSTDNNSANALSPALENSKSPSSPQDDSYAMGEVQQSPSRFTAPFNGGYAPVHEQQR
ncbi:organic solute transporter Ostalpha-domain-containing protein [Zychaea mexicana]|uniref:organic solute transporter Ostalpha-domain-containing protein n=1 Tax=Zychaea mexicana TaxID=64656 RepID=UPI0022FEB55A|nr:organic solute transporter Ostalpha-domain-containing protein [Zychaea mexicana]KAI9491824.1 organic solute transporter Ostalpha-domain-containing protein [Zychaea mexicana]